MNIIGLPLTTFLAGAAIAIPLVYIAISYIHTLNLRRKLPPGPFPLPLIGNRFHVPKTKPWIYFEQQSQVYDNPLLTFWQGSRPIIVCNDAWTISDLFEKRAGIYSSRPHMVMMGDVIGDATRNNQTAMVYGNRWRMHRRLTHAAVGPQIVRNYRKFQSEETAVLIQDLLDLPADFVLSIERWSCSIVSIVGWSRRIAKINDEVAQCALQIMEAVDMIIPFLFIPETFPFLARLPSLLAKLYSLPSRLNESALRSGAYFYALSKEAFQKSDRDCFAKQLLTEQAEKGELRDREVASLTANLIGGGVDTSSSTTISLILALCTHPSFQQKAQEEIDRVVGHERMPTFDDEESLPLVRAMVSEVLRWRTTTILGGIPHAPTQDDMYRNYLIPKETWILGNVWAIHRHPREYPDPDVFRPERFLDGLERPYPNKRGHNAFGWGKRVCSGQPLAEQSLFIVAARLVWAFHVRPGLDAGGNEVPLDIFAYTKSENMRPEPFRARFLPRSEKIFKVIRSEAETARRELSVYDSESRLSIKDF